MEGLAHLVVVLVVRHVEEVPDEGAVVVLEVLEEPREVLAVGRPQSLRALCNVRPFGGSLYWSLILFEIRRGGPFPSHVHSSGLSPCCHLSQELTERWI